MSMGVMLLIEGKREEKPNRSDNTPKNKSSEDDMFCSAIATTLWRQEELFFHLIYSLIKYTSDRETKIWSGHETTQL